MNAGDCLKILFHTNTLNYRGTTVAVADYARYNQSLLGNTSVIAYDKSYGFQEDIGTYPQIVEELSKSFEVVGYEGPELLRYIDKHQVDLAYFIKAGFMDGRYPSTAPGESFGCPTAVHAVFQANQPHGDRYAYISEWLSLEMSGGAAPYVPHIVSLPAPTGDFRASLGIAESRIVIGRYGGLHTFDIPFVHQAVLEQVNRNSNFVFLFMGTQPFANHPNIIFCNEMHDLQVKSNFINTCDAMLHARQGGESFGLSIAEFLSLGKPVMAWSGGQDKNHTVMLKDSGLLYDNADDLLRLFDSLGDFTEDWALRTRPFTPDLVMKKFQQVFID